MPALWWFAETTLVAAGLALVAALAGRLRSIGPTVRHILWLVVLIKLMTPPLISWPWPAPWQNLRWPTISLEAVPSSIPMPVGDFDQPRFVPQAPDADRPAVAERKIAVVSCERGGDGRGSRIAAAGVPGPPPQLQTWHLPLPDEATLAGAILMVWLIVSLAVGAAQTIRIIRFRRLLEGALPAPDDLIEEAQRISLRLGVRRPELLVVPNLVTPMLWCLGRSKLLLPERLLESLPLDHWRGILMHELAHLKRGDHWVSRLELAAGLIWWWNPLYWLTRSRLDAEAELACDAWVVWALPKDRLAYAEVLFDICATLSLARPPAPALGVTGSGRFFERRLTMILHDHVPCRPSPLSVLAACLLALFALPSWSAAQRATTVPEDELALALVAQTDHQATLSVVDDDEKVVIRTTDDDDDDDDADDDDDDQKAAAKAKRKAKEAKAKAAAKARAKATAKRKARKSELEIEHDLSRIEKEIEAKLAPLEKEIEAKLAPLEKEIEAKLGPEFEKSMAELGEKIAKEIGSQLGSGSDFEKKMAELGEKIGKEIGSQLGSGSDFEKKMAELGEKMGKEIEGKFGPDSEFTKKMETFGKEMETRFGPGSEFAKKMEAFGKDMEAKFGPGSEFAKKMEALGKDMEAKFGPGSEFRKKIDDQHRAALEAHKDAMKKRSPSRDNTKERSKAPETARDRRRERRINELEAQIKKLIEELKALREETGEK
jgi:bla regulator protein blaR1